MRLEEMAIALADIKLHYQPKDGADHDLRIFNALSVAEEEILFVGRLLQKRAEDNVIITPTDPLDLHEAPTKWCDHCDNPALACTCGRAKHDPR